jgi:hypothetical protein
MVLRLLSFFSLSCLLMASTAQSAVVTYTLAGGTVSGTLNGVAFSNANITVTADADPSNFVLGTVNVYPILTQQAVTTMTIDGVGSFVFSNPNFGPFLIDTTLLFGPGTGYGGFGFQDGPSVLKGLAALGPMPSFPPGSVTITGSLLSGPSGETYATSAGDLIFEYDDGALATFSGGFPSSAVPEPTSMAIFGLGSLGMAYRARRKLKA